MANIRSMDVQSQGRGLLGALARGVPVGMGVAFLLSLILTAVLLGGEDPMQLLAAFAYLAMFLGAAVCGIVCALYERPRAMVYSAAGGGVYIALMLILSLFVSGSSGGSMDIIRALLVYGGCELVSIIAGLLLRPKKRRIGEGRQNPAAMARRQLGRR